MTAPTDPTRGLHGVMSAVLVFEAITILLGLTVVGNGGTRAPGWQIAVVLALAVAHLATPAVISRRFAPAVIGALQVLLTACWVFHAAIGVMGIVFGLVWILIGYMGREVRRRAAAGTIVGATGGDGPGYTPTARPTDRSTEPSAERPTE